VKLFAERTDLSPAALSRLFSTNASRLYRLPLPATDRSLA
jgi:hypothetical protein